MSHDDKSTLKKTVSSQIKFAFVVSAIAGVVAGRADDGSFELEKVIGTGVFALLACFIVIGISALFKLKN